MSDQSSRLNRRSTRARCVIPSRILVRSAMYVAAAIGGVAANFVSVQAQLPPTNGMRESDLRTHAIVDATVIPAPGEKIEHATIVMRDGVIAALGPKDQIQIPDGARIWKGEGMTVYPGLIESALMIPASASPGAGSHWNTRIRPEINMVDQPAPDQSLRKDLRSMGFTAAAVYPNSGAMRGSGALIALADETKDVLAYKPKLAIAMAFDYGGGRRFGGRQFTEAPSNEPPVSPYPGSLMGSIALLRQTLLDAQWHADCMRIWQTHPQGNEPPQRDDALEALRGVIDSQNRQQVLFEVSDELNALRAAKLAKEFDLDMILLGSGMEFRELNDILATKMPIIVPLDFPKRPDVSTLSAADGVSLRDMMTWEQAPTNARRLLKGGATIALTTHRLRSRTEFPANLRAAIKHGLNEDDALAALTTTPAKLLGVDNMMGTIAPGKVANLVVVKGSLFNKDGKIYDTWVDGRRFEINSDAAVQLKGSGTITIEPEGAATGAETRGEDAAAHKELKIDVDTVKSTVTIYLPDNKKVAARKVVVQQDQISFLTDGRPLRVKGYVRFSGVIEGNPPSSITGVGAMPDESKFHFTIQIKPGSTVESQPAGENEKEGEKAQGDEHAESQPAAEEHKDQPREVEAQHEAEKPADPVSGTWTVHAPAMHEDTPIALTLKLDGRSVSGNASVAGQTMELKDGNFDPATGKLTFTILDEEGQPGTADATISNDSITGHYNSPQLVTEFSGTRQRARARNRNGGDNKAEEETFVMPPEELNFPLGEYGRSEPPKQQNLLVINATIWTCGPQGIIKNGWMRIGNGKVLEIGSGNPPSANAGINGITLDLKGKHVTPGIIDCHSHTGINGGVNEFGETNTAECRIADCIDPTDIDWYHQLAGGTVAANQLHGSANPIGGQNSVVKIRWGAAGGADAFPIRDAIPGIKFALGENVKRSQGRYPNTRMGVETFDRDAFTAAKDYKAKWERYNALPAEKKAAAMPPQRDLELDTLVEILDGKRLVHCHSYRQDEILMLIRIADDFGFKIGTFQHVLEGYKVADAIAKHGAGGSTFSDWWAYKIEVMDAIPYNAALMHDVGVVMSFNSDSDELARRLNWEAAKAVRYGGVSPEEALKFVTINPAKQLRIDNHCGSLEKGKDADFVVWSADPLSVYSRCEQTWIEGAKYFDLESDKQMREQIRSERQRLIQKILTQTHGDPTKAGAENRGGPGEGRPEGGPGRPDGERRFRRRPPQDQLAWMQEQARLGRDPLEVLPGECGCDEDFDFDQE